MGSIIKNRKSRCYVYFWLFVLAVLFIRIQSPHIARVLIGMAMREMIFPNLAKSRQNLFCRLSLFYFSKSVWQKCLLRARANNKLKVCLLMHRANSTLKTPIVLFSNMRPQLHVNTEVHFLAVVCHPIGPLRKQNLAHSWNYNMKRLFFCFSLAKLF